MKKTRCFILLILLVPFFAHAQITYKGGFEKLYRVFGKTVRAGDSWNDSSHRSSKICFVEIVIQPDGKIGDWHILNKGQQDSVETRSIFNAVKKTDTSWLNSSQQAGTVLIPIVFIRQGDNADDEGKIAKKMLDGFNFVTYSNWVAVKPTLMEPMVVVIFDTVRKTSVQSTK